jgi:crossover junction endodeoxyribonuclease RuvC
MPSKQRILGIDPGSIITGWGVIEGDRTRFQHVGNGSIFTRKKEFHQRLIEIHRGLKEMIATYQPTQVSIEQVFMAKNAQSALKLGHARGVALITALEAGLEVHEYTPMAIKQAVTGYGKASKEQVGRMVQTMLGLTEAPQTDAGDALGAAICHMLHLDQPALSPLLAELSKSKRSRRRSSWPGGSR